MKNAKRNYLKYIGKQLKKMFNELDDSLNIPGAQKLESGFHTNLNSMKMFYDQVLNIQEWPFTSSIVIRVLLVILAPLSGILLNIVTTRSIG